MEEKEDRIRRLENLCWAVATMPAVLVSLANRHGITWVEEIRNQARTIIDDLNKEIES